MAELPPSLYHVAGEPWMCVFSDKVLIGNGNVVCAVPTSHEPNARTILAQDPAATWFARVFRDGTPQAVSGDGVRVLLAALLDSGTMYLNDRRDAVPFATPHGIRDVLLGRAGSAVDIGRWGFLHTDREFATVNFSGSMRHVSFSGEAPHTVQAAETVLVNPQQLQLTEGILRVPARVVTWAGQERASSGLGAAACALALRHTLPPDAPHHWLVQFPGGDIAVRMFPTEEGEHVSVRSVIKRG